MHVSVYNTQPLLQLKPAWIIHGARQELFYNFLHSENDAYGLL